MKQRFLLRIRPPLREGFLASVKTVGASLGVEVRNPKWTSYGALEVDLFPPSPQDFRLFLAAVAPLGDVEFWRDLYEAPKSLSKEEHVEEARAFFNAERYWECHEVLEGIWRNSSGAEKSFLQGMILVCAAFVHHQKGEPDVALGVMRRAVGQLDWPQPRYLSVDAAAMKAS